MASITHSSRPPVPIPEDLIAPRPVGVGTLLAPYSGYFDTIADRLPSGLLATWKLLLDLAIDNGDATPFEVRVGQERAALEGVLINDCNNSSKLMEYTSDIERFAIAASLPEECRHILLESPGPLGRKERILPELQRLDAERPFLARADVPRYLRPFLHDAVCAMVGHDEPRADEVFLNLHFRIMNRLEPFRGEIQKIRAEVRGISQDHQSA